MPLSDTNLSGNENRATNLQKHSRKASTDKESTSSKWTGMNKKVYDTGIYKIALSDTELYDPIYKQFCWSDPAIPSGEV